jgi:hypothetical protein
VVEEADMKTWDPVLAALEVDMVTPFQQSSSLAWYMYVARRGLFGSSGPTLDSGYPTPPMEHVSAAARSDEECVEVSAQLTQGRFLLAPTLGEAGAKELYAESILAVNAC